MPLQIKISLRAAREIRQAAQWWQANRPSAPGAVARDLAEGLALLAEQPGIGAKFIGTKLPEVRRMYLSRLGYFVYFSADENSLKVLAFWHSSRKAQPRI